MSQTTNLPPHPSLPPGPPNPPPGPGSPPGQPPAAPIAGRRLTRQLQGCPTDSSQVGAEVTLAIPGLPTNVIDMIKNGNLLDAFKASNLYSVLNSQGMTQSGSTELGIAVT
eukprot:4531764-Prymnesium_polylepis.1